MSFSEKYKKYAVVDDVSIKGFFDDYRWLSNFYISPVWFEGLCYPSTECAFQAAKLVEGARLNFIHMTPVQAKKSWKDYPRLDKDAQEWDARKYDVMSVIVFDKFYRHKDLRQKLLDTGRKQLEETNHWSDVYWGVDIVKGGENNLGRILMLIREYWRITELLKLNHNLPPNLVS